MNDPRITEEIMNQERSRSWLMNPPPTQTAPLPSNEAEPDTAPVGESKPGNPKALTSGGTPRLAREQVSESRRKAVLVRWARWRERAQNGAAAKAEGSKSGHSKRQARYLARLSPEERSAEMRRRMAARKAKHLDDTQPAAKSAAQQSTARAETSTNGRSSHSLVEQLQAIQARGKELAQAAAELLSLIIH